MPFKSNKYFQPENMWKKKTDPDALEKYKALTTEDGDDDEEEEEEDVDEGFNDDDDDDD